jgi:hypothetical protein
MSQPEPQPAAAAPPTPAPQPVIRDQHQLVLTNAWAYHRERFLALQADGIDRNAIAPNGIPMGTAENALSERIGQFRAKGVSYDEIAVKLKQRIDVGEAECRRENHTKWFGPMTAWAHGQFWRALETTVEQASEPRPTVAARASPRAAIGPVKPPASHPVSAGLENF